METTSTHAIDLTLLESVLVRYHGRSRSALLPLLHEAQAIYGWLPREVQEAVSRTLRVPLADVHGVVEFYAMFYNEPTARRVVRVCEDIACTLRGADAVAQAIEAELGLQPGETSADGRVTYERVPCLGMCEHAPNGLNGTRLAGDLTATAVPDFLAGVHPEPEPKIYGTPLLKLGRIGKMDPLSFKDYLAHDGYVGLRRVMQYTPEQIIQIMESSAILGRGGAMFPIGLKWKFTRGAPGTPAEKHIVANADESEPGTFKDRAILEGDPYSLIEAMSMAAYVVGAENGWIFVRGEYPRAYERLCHAVQRAQEEGYLGRNMLGRQGFHFNIEVRLGAGAYICGEETALFEAIEGKRGFPRIKPPFPTTNGLFQQPTAINNVETLVAALTVARIGVDEWLRFGTDESAGTKWFCLSGHIQRPGLYELPFGVSIRELIQMGGGVRQGKHIQAVLIGGAAGAFIGPEQLDAPLTYEGARQHGFPIGSGVVMVLDETADMRRILYKLSHFFAHESCGKCFPCQIGTQRQMEILQRISHDGGPRPGDRAALMDIGFTMTQTSLCGLGQTAASAIMSAIQLWPELVG
ncbi:MAG: NAD(P)H-dependent oxidoreductase subunit E [Chloroflexi bacterium]|nr:NAD(P)H-dependent oxidoreductase subunit E [Chloroflexota bacterium]